MIAQSFFSYFVDPILRAPTIGCMLMCLAASLMGVVLFLRKESLIGEALSHAAYPGVIAGVIAAGFLQVKEDRELVLSLLILAGAFFTGILGLWTIQQLEKKLKVPNDAALCFVLSTFFGVGITLASEVQFSFTALYKQVLTYLYGQAATMTDIHIVIYGVLALVVVLVIVCFYKELQVMTFDQEYAKSLGIRVRLIDLMMMILVALSVIIGIRSVGVVLMSAMLIAPAVAARQFTNRLSVLFFIAGCLGMASGFFGNYLSAELSDKLTHFYPSSRINLPTGPMIVLTASLFAALSILGAPERGLFIRLGRAVRFRYVCICENILKAMWRMGPQDLFSFDRISLYQEISPLYLKFLLWRMRRNGWIEKVPCGDYRLTRDGKYRAANIVRLHRLWEAYLANYLGFGVERVHCNAEEMEHIITPELEKQLILLLKDPKKDPHAQPIPPKGGLDVN